MPLAARDLGSIQTAADFDLDPLCAESQRLFDGLSHCAAEGNSFFQLRGDFFRLQLSIQFRFVYLLNRYEHFASRLRRKITFQLVDLGAFATDDNAGARCVDDDLQSIGSALDINVRHSSSGEPLL